MRNTRLVPRAGNFGAKLRQTGLFNQHVMQGYEPHDDRLVVPKLPNMSGIATRHHKGTHKVVKETSRTFKGGASNLPAALREPASEATLSVCFRDAAKQGPRAKREADARI